jgi:hypothetical protein
MLLSVTANHAATAFRSANFRSVFAQAALVRLAADSMGQITAPVNVSLRLPPNASLN